jgi:hypothetical protein
MTFVCVYDVNDFKAPYGAAAETMKAPERHAADLSFDA